MEPFVLQPPIWELVKKSCPQGELDDVKESIGPSLVELSSDLYQEVGVYSPTSWGTLVLHTVEVAGRGSL